MLYDGLDCCLGGLGIGLSVSHDPKREPVASIFIRWLKIVLCHGLKAVAAIEFYSADRHFVFGRLDFDIDGFVCDGEQEEDALRTIVDAVESGLGE